MKSPQKSRLRRGFGVFWTKTVVFFVLKDKIFAPAAQTLAPEVIWSPSTINIKWSRTEQHIQKLDEWVQCELEVFLWRSAAGAKIFRVVPCQKTFLQCKNGVCERFEAVFPLKNKQNAEKNADFELNPRAPLFSDRRKQGGFNWKGV